DTTLDLSTAQMAPLLGRDPIVTTECQLEPAANRRAVDGCHDRFGTGFNLVDQLGQVRLLNFALELRDVGASREEAPRAGEHDGGNPRIGIGLAKGLLKPEAQGVA